MCHKEYRFSKAWYLFFCKPLMKGFDHGTDLPPKKLFLSVGYCCFCYRSEHNLCGVDFTPKITIWREEKSRQRREEKRAMSGKFLPSLLYPPSPTAHFAWLCLFVWDSLKVSLCWFCLWVSRGHLTRLSSQMTNVQIMLGDAISPLHRVNLLTRHSLNTTKSTFQVCEDLLQPSLDLFVRP